MAASNTELARIGFAAAANGDFDALAELLDPDVKWHGGDPSAKGSCQNRKQALQWMRIAAKLRGGTIPDLVEVLEAGSDRVVVIMRPSERSDDSGAAAIANVVTFRNGKAIEMIHFPDAAKALSFVEADHSDSD